MSNTGGGVLKPWQMAHQVVVRMRADTPNIHQGANQPANDVTVSIERPIEYLLEIWLTEYMVRNNGTPAANNMWRIDLSKNNLVTEQSCNSAGVGYAICVPDMANTTHVVYDQPRVMVLDGKRGVNSLRVRLTDEFGADVTFHDVTLCLTLVYVHPTFSLKDVRMANDLNLQWWRSNENAERFKDRQTGRFV